MVIGTNKRNSKDHITFQGGIGTAQLGTFTTKFSGFGDTHRLNLNAGLTVPIGSITQEDPVGTRPTQRLRIPSIRAEGPSI